MRIIKLDATESTNSFLRDLGYTNSLEDYTVVVTKQQTQGRGQMGTVWRAKPGENLTFSVFKAYSHLKIENQFYISMAVSLALVAALKDFNVRKISVKWPNDILSENKKICGILIENVIKQNVLDSSIIGVGLNVNQKSFTNLPKATSMAVQEQQFFELDDVLLTFLKHLKLFFKQLEEGEFSTLHTRYEAVLFRKNKPSTFKDAEGCVFSGFIRGVSSTGHLQVLLEDEILKTFSLKEISLLY
ncbi:biotin--[acetyl-CoA-carboxylase] ligase [Bizionia paragorgiae]|uniref:biotin--[acetyl-CoA-carboxylase] ligase n=1 Tax=Bizionia paragorgiae TaxID=283786 RepID=UPI00299DCC31|nr:biotin--[acetyl-CoA-carboxylase] ligase [Bizionia paragorgiae]MDX1272016.1 biotin--[acetyl-CoA-carboxylase] ligase [Bizionia paragorgiae]